QLLASPWRATDNRGTSCMLVEYTNHGGAHGFVRARYELAVMTQVCDDGIELADHGDSVLMSHIMRALTDAGGKIIATSNTLPGSLGEGRFAAQDFLREIQALADQFEVYRIDGQDYRHRALSSPARPLPEGELTAAADELDGVVAR